MAQAPDRPVFHGTSNIPPHTPLRAVTHPPHIPDHVLLRKIGSGSYGEVWLARNVFGTHRAIKIIYRDSFEDSRPFEREFLGIQKFEPISRAHAGFLHILQVGRNEDGGYFYYVMELADDGVSDAIGPQEVVDPDRYIPKTLKSILRTRGSLPVSECIQLGLFLANALARLHRGSLIHRDIKPSNIIFVNGVPKLADIGLVASLDATRSLVGTEGFIPPEGPGQPQGDLYSLGKVLYEISTGKDRLDYPEPPTALGRFADREKFLEFNEVILKACAWERQKRYQSAEEMHDDLALLQGGKSLKRLRKLERRLAMVSRIGSTVALIGLIAGGFYYHTMRAARAAKENLTRLHVANGFQHLNEGDPLGSLPWFAEALKLEEGNPRREPTHRLRLASVLRESPRLVRAWTFAQAIRSIELDGEATLAATVSDEGGVAIWDIAAGKRLMALTQLNLPIRHAALSPDGRLLILSGEDGSVSIWDVGANQPSGPPLKCEGVVKYSTFSPNGRFAISLVDQGSDLGLAYVWNAAIGKFRSQPFRQKGFLSSGEFSPDGRCLATASGDYAARLWDVSNGTPLLQVPHTDVIGAFFSFDGKRLCTTSRDGTARIWDGSTGAPRSPLLEHRGAILQAAFSPDGTRLVTASEDETAMVWDAEGGGPVGLRLAHPQAVRRAQFSPDGRYVVTICADDLTRVWDPRAQTPLAILPGNGRILRTWFSADGRQLYMADRSLLRVWDLAARNDLETQLDHDHAVSTVHFSRDGRTLLTLSDGAARLWDSASGELEATLYDRGPGLAAFSPNGTQLLTLESDGAACIFDRPSGKRLMIPPNAQGQILHAAFSPDGRLLVTAGSDGRAQVWETTSGRPATGPLLHEGPVNTAVFSPDGRRILTASEDGTASIWNITFAPQRALIFRADGPVSWARFDPNARAIIAAFSRQRAGSHSKQIIRRWNVESGRTLGDFINPGKALEASAIAPNGRSLVVNNDYSAQVWDLTTGQPTTRPLRHSSEITWCAFSADGDKVVSASRDGRARVWSLHTSEPLTPWLRHQGPISYAEFSADDSRLVTASEDSTARVWNLSIDNRPVDDWLQTAQLLTGKQIDATGAAVALNGAPLDGQWRKLAARYSADFTFAAPEVSTTYTWHQRQLSKCKQAWQLPGALFHLSCALRLKPGVGQHWLDRALVHAQMLKPEQSAADYQRALTLPGASDWGGNVLYLLALGDSPAYRQSCETLLDRVTDTMDAEIATETAWACVLAPLSLTRSNLPVRLAERGLNHGMGVRNRLTVLGATLYRAGRYQEAVNRLDQAVTTEPRRETGFDFVFLAMANQQLGRSRLARQWLDKALRWTQNLDIPREGTVYDPAQRWKSCIEFHLLFNEAQSLIHSTGLTNPGGFEVGQGKAWLLDESPDH